jgi:hypothetical protein
MEAAVVLPFHFHSVALAASTAVMLSLALAPVTANAAESSMALFKVVTVKDEIVVGFGAVDVAVIGQTLTAETVAAALDSRHNLGAWLYATKRGSDGQIVMAPLRRVGLLVGNILRIESYSSEQPVTAPEK